MKQGSVFSSSFLALGGQVPLGVAAQGTKTRNSAVYRAKMARSAAERKDLLAFIANPISRRKDDRANRLERLVDRAL